MKKLLIVFCLLMICINIQAENRYRDEIDEARNKHVNEIIEYATKPCYTALLKNTDLLNYVDNRKEAVEAVKQSIAQIATKALVNSVKGTNAKYRSDLYQRYVDECIETYKPVVENLVKQAQKEKQPR